MPHRKNPKQKLSHRKKIASLKETAMANKFQAKGSEVRTAQTGKLRQRNFCERLCGWIFSLFQGKGPKDQNHESDPESWIEEDFQRPVVRAVSGSLLSPLEPSIITEPNPKVGTIGPQKQSRRAEQKKEKFPSYGTTSPLARPSTSRQPTGNSGSALRGLDRVPRIKPSSDSTQNHVWPNQGQRVVKEKKVSAHAEPVPSSKRRTYQHMNTKYDTSRNRRKNQDLPPKHTRPEVASQVHAETEYKTIEIESIGAVPRSRDRIHTIHRKLIETAYETCVLHNEVDSTYTKTSVLPVPAIAPIKYEIPRLGENVPAFAMSSNQDEDWRTSHYDIEDLKNMETSKMGSSGSTPVKLYSVPSIEGPWPLEAKSTTILTPLHGNGRAQTESEPRIESTQVSNEEDSDPSTNSSCEHVPAPHHGLSRTSFDEKSQSWQVECKLCRERSVSIKEAQFVPSSKQESVNGDVESLASVYSYSDSESDEDYAPGKDPDQEVSIKKETPSFRNVSKHKRRKIAHLERDSNAEIVDVLENHALGAGNANDYCNVFDQELLQEAKEYGIEQTHSSESRIDHRHFLGVNKGILWQNNSCYMDSTLICFFYGSTTFNYILVPNPEDTPLTQSVRDALRKIVQLLETTCFCDGSQVTLFREAIGQKNPNMLEGFADPEEFLYTLFEDVLDVPPFIWYTSGTSDIMHMITLGEGPSGSPGTTLQDLLEVSLKENGGLRFAGLPAPALLIQLPRSDGVLQQYKHVVPNLELTLDLLMAEGAESVPSRMDLAGVICIRHAHYTAFLKVGGSWAYFDSMYGYGKSNVEEAPEIYQYLAAFERNSTDLNVNEFPEKVQRILLDAHICMYLPSIDK